MRFFISVPDGLMAIDNVAITMDVSAFINTRYIVWNENGSGFIEPSTGIALRTSFNDPSPYQTIINSWMTIQAATNPALTLAQAQSIKNQLISAIYLVKSQAPVSVTVGAGAFQWDASPDAVTTLLGYTGEEYIPPLNTTVTDLNALITDYNSLLTFIQAPNFATAIQAKINAALAEINTAISTANTNEFIATSGSNGIDPFIFAQFPLSSVGAPSTSGIPGSASTQSLFSVPTLNVVPHGHTSSVNVTLAELRSILNAITTQRVNEQVVLNSKQAIVNALSTVASVIAYDATTGW